MERLMAILVDRIGYFNINPYLRWTLEIAMRHEAGRPAIISLLDNQSENRMPDHLFEAWKWWSLRLAASPPLIPNFRYEPCGEFLPMNEQQYQEVVHSLESLEKEFGFQPLPLIRG